MAPNDPALEVNKTDMSNGTNATEVENLQLAGMKNTEKHESDDELSE